MSKPTFDPEQALINQSIYAEISQAERSLMQWSLSANAGGGVPRGLAKFLQADEWLHSAKLAGLAMVPGDGTKPAMEDGFQWLTQHDTHLTSWLVAVDGLAGNELAAKLPIALREFALPAGRSPVGKEWEESDMAAPKKPGAIAVAETIMETDPAKFSPLIGTALRQWAGITLAPHGAVTSMVLRAACGSDLFKAGLVTGAGSQIGFSRAFAERKTDYVESLTAANAGNFGPWLSNFARAASASASEAMRKLGQTRSAKVVICANLGGQRRAEPVATFLASTPRFTLGDMAADAGVAYNTASSHARFLESLGLVRESGRDERGQWFESMSAAGIMKAGKASKQAAMNQRAKAEAIEDMPPLPSPVQRSGNLRAKTR